MPGGIGYSVTSSLNIWIHIVISNWNRCLLKFIDSIWLVTSCKNFEVIYFIIIKAANIEKSRKSENQKKDF